MEKLVKSTDFSTRSLFTLAMANPNHSMAKFLKKQNCLVKGQNVELFRAFSRFSSKISESLRRAAKELRRPGVGHN
jgi:hypothetical protein